MFLIAVGIFFVRVIFLRKKYIKIYERRNNLLKDFNNRFKIENLELMNKYNKPSTKHLCPSLSNKNVWLIDLPLDVNHGIIICPECDGELKWGRHATTRQTYGVCKTNDCIAWME